MRELDDRSVRGNPTDDGLHSSNELCDPSLHNRKLYVELRLSLENQVCWIYG